jgi:type I restriction enzyme S subunit
MPAGWKSKTLKELCLPITKSYPAAIGRSKILYIDIGSVDGERHMLVDVAEIDAAAAPSRCRQIVKAGDTVFSTVRPYLEKIAYVDEALDDQFASTGFAVLRPGPDLLPKYLHYYSISRGMLDQVLPLQKGVSYPAVLDKEVRATTLPVPPLADQHRIVELLEDYLSRLDAAETDLESAARRLASLAKATWKRTFVETDLAAVPLLDVAAIANGQTPKGLIDRLRAEAGPTTVPFYKVGDMNAGDGRYMSDARTHVSEVDAKVLGLHIRGVGTVLIPKRGGAIATNKKRLLAGPAAYDLNTMGLVPSEELDPLYLWHWLQGVDLGKLADGSQVPQINAPQIRGLRLPVPPRDVQKQIVDELEQAMDARSRLATAASDARRRGAQLRRSILAAAFSGRLTVSRDLSVAAEMIGS